MSKHLTKSSFKLQGKSAETSNPYCEVEPEIIAFSRGMYEYNIQKACSNYQKGKNPRVCDECNHFKKGDCRPSFQTSLNFEK